MAPHAETEDPSQTREEDGRPSAIASERAENQVSRWKKFLGASKLAEQPANSESSPDGFKKTKTRTPKSSLGILNDRETAEVPGV